MADDQELIKKPEIRMDSIAGSSAGTYGRERMGVAVAEIQQIEVGRTSAARTMAPLVPVVLMGLVFVACGGGGCKVDSLVLRGHRRLHADARGGVLPRFRGQLS